LTDFKKGPGFNQPDPHECPSRKPLKPDPHEEPSKTMLFFMLAPHDKPSIRLANPQKL